MGTTVTNPPSTTGPQSAGNRIEREQSHFDKTANGRSPVSILLDRFSKGFYDKGPQGRLWGPVWEKLAFDGARVLDYGCGCGDFSWLLSGLGAKVVALDISPQSVLRASRSEQATANGQPRFLVADGHRTPFADNSLDYVVGNGALHHLELEDAYAEIARILRPGGKAFFVEPMYHHPLLWLLRRLTPRSHTADERPLCAADIEKARRWFRKVSRREHFLLAACAAPAHLFGRQAALAVIGGMDRFDQLLMRAAPPLRQFAWLVALEMEK
jgi:SAM-dependent methyltransferase